VFQRRLLSGEANENFLNVLFHFLLLRNIFL
jgi:hypothetical protein